MKIKRIEHVGAVVRDLEASRRLWEDCFGIPLAGVEASNARPQKLALYPIGESMVELLAGTTPDSKFARMVAEGKGGLHHICFEVENIDGALAELKAKGIPLLDEVPRIGHAGCRIAFLDPAGTEDCLIAQGVSGAFRQQVIVDNRGGSAIIPAQVVAKSLLKAGRLRGLAVTSRQPSALTPGLPTMEAAGLPGFDVWVAYGILAPAGTPAAIVSRLNQAIVQALKPAEAREKLLNAGLEAVGSSPEQLANAMKTEIATVGKVIKDAGIRVD